MALRERTHRFQTDVLGWAFNSGPPGLREQAAKSLRKLRLDRAEIVNALQTTATQDPDYQVRERAREALTALGHTPPERILPPSVKSVSTRPPGKVYKSKRDKVIDFLIGFASALGINLVMFIGLMLINLIPDLSLAKPIAIENTYPFWSYIWSAPIGANLLAMIYFAFKRKWIAFGWLVVIALFLIPAL